MPGWLDDVSTGFWYGSSTAWPFHLLFGASAAAGKGFLGNLQTTLSDQGLVAAARYGAVGAWRGMVGAAQTAWNAGLSIPRIYRIMPNSDARLGYGLGVAAMVGAPILAGAAMYSGLNNLRQGRFGRAVLQLVGGAALIGSLYGMPRYFSRPATSTTTRTLTM